VLRCQARPMRSRHQFSNRRLRGGARRMDTDRTPERPCKNASSAVESSCKRIIRIFEQEGSLAHWRTFGRGQRARRIAR
jgi:hypothetical protein